MNASGGSQMANKPSSKEGNQSMQATKETFNSKNRNSQSKASNTEFEDNPLDQFDKDKAQQMYLSEYLNGVNLQNIN